MMRWRLPVPEPGLTRILVLTARLAVLGGVLTFLVAAGAAQAHVDIDVGDGQYIMEVGFRDEPAFLGQPNAIFIHVEEYATGGTEPVNGLAATLTAEVSKDGQAFSPPLVPMGEGIYEAAFVPTETGDYTFRISGAIGEATVDESVTSGPTTFNSVEPLSTIEFPVARPDLAQVQAAVSAAQADAATARTLGIAGIVAGVLGILVAAAAFARSGGKPAEPIVERQVPAGGESSGKLIR
jgi:hypothetical protein